jgi:hypothetical protein
VDREFRRRELVKELSAAGAWYTAKHSPEQHTRLAEGSAKPTTPTPTSSFLTPSTTPYE